jgi:hypothetical protein
MVDTAKVYLHVNKLLAHVPGNPNRFFGLVSSPVSRLKPYADFRKAVLGISDIVELR